MTGLTWTKAVAGLRCHHCNQNIEDTAEALAVWGADPTGLGGDIHLAHADCDAKYRGDQPAVTMPLAGFLSSVKDLAALSDDAFTAALYKGAGLTRGKR